MDERLKNRCVTCKYWEGDRAMCMKFFNSTENKEKFLNADETWANDGVCVKINYGIDIDVDGVFGCILHEPCE